MIHFQKFRRNTLFNVALLVNLRAVFYQLVHISLSLLHYEFIGINFHQQDKH